MRREVSSYVDTRLLRALLEKHLPKTVKIDGFEMLPEPPDGEVLIGLIMTNTKAMGEAANMQGHLRFPPKGTLYIRDSAGFVRPTKLLADTVKTFAQAVQEAMGGISLEEKALVEEVVEEPPRPQAPPRVETPPPVMPATTMVGSAEEYAQFRQRMKTHANEASTT